MHDTNIKLYTASFDYNNYTVVFINNDFIEFEILDKDFSLLYSDRQTININKEDEYELKFNIEVYKKDPLYIYGSNNNYAILNNCQNNEKEVTCLISKEKLEEILVENNEQFKIGAMNYKIGVIQFEHILNITVNYENVQKQDIYLEIKDIVGGITEMGVPVGLVTNVTEIPNFISAKFEDIKYFKKISGRPLILFYNYSNETEYNLKSNYTKEVIINNIHYKYNFRIQPSSFESKISVKDQGTSILLTYPQELIYSYEEETSKIMYIMNDPDSAEQIRITDHPSPSNLICTELNKMKLCDVPKSHFRERYSGYYNTSRSNHERQNSIYYDSSPIKVTIPLEINIIRYYLNIPIGNKGIIYFRTDYNDAERNVFNDSDIEENTKFQTSISCGNKNYSNISCHLWKNSESIIHIFCKLNENLGNESNYINIDEAKFIYDKEKIYIKQIKNFEFTFIQLEKQIPFLYSKKQIINLEEGKNTYYLKFNAVNYQNEILTIYIEDITEIILDNCSIKKNELQCQINKSIFDEYYLPEFNIRIYYPYSGGPSIPTGMIEKISVNYNYTSPKINLNCTIGKLFENFVDKNNFFAYEVKTNVGDISNFVSQPFGVSFNYVNEKDGSIEETCVFKKTNENPLYLLCKSWQGNISISLKKFKNEGDGELIDLHQKYNFYIQPKLNNDTITIGENGDSLSFTIPKILDFSTNDTISIDLALSYSNYTKGIRLNPNANRDLECEDLISIKRCFVPKSHFSSNQSGYYNIYHLNYMNKYIKFYECSPIKIIFPNVDNRSSKPKNLVGIIVGSVVGGLALIAAIVIIIIFVKKRKNKSSEINKSGTNILPNSNQIELVEGDKFGNE